MSTYTDNYQLEKPVQSDSGDVSVLNRNSDKIDTIMHASQVSIADAYDENATYNTGDVVMYEFFLYICLDDNVTGTWDATKWQRTTAANVADAPALSALTDVDITTPSDGDALVYDGTNSKWINGSAGGFGFADRTSVDTGMKWTDGSPIKVFSFNYASAVQAGNEWAALSQFGFSDTVTRILFASGFIIDNVNGFTWTLGTPTNYFTTLEVINGEATVRWTQGTAGTPYIQVYYI